MPQAPTMFLIEEISSVPGSESDDSKRYSRAGTRTWQSGLGSGVVLSETTRVRAV